MRQGGKPRKSKPETRRSVGRKSPKNDASGRRELEQRLAEALNREAEALARETATAEILRVISSSPTDLQPVMDAVAESAARLCEADAVIFTRDGDLFERVANFGSTPTGRLGERLRLTRGHVGGRAMMDGTPLQVPDIQAAQDEFPDAFAVRTRAPLRTVLAVPLMREGMATGVIVARRLEVRPFSSKQIELLQTFADQAVIAIENVRLFKELEARNRDLTATSEILQVISRSPTDVQPIFDTIAERAMRLCSASFGAVFMFDGELIHLSALANVRPEGVDALRKAYPRIPSQASNVGRVILLGDVVEIPDVLADPDYQLTGAAAAAGFRSTLGVPMLHQGRPIGVVVVSRPEPGAFSGEQIQLLRTFADQAVIAVENVRLFTELQEKNEALTQAHAQVTEALEQQTATSEILGVISSSPTDVQPVFDAIAAAATRLCGAVNGLVGRFDGQLMHLVAHHNVAPERLDALRQAYPRPADRGSLSGRVVTSRAVVHVEDVDADPEYTLPRATTVGYRSVLGVPMLREGAAIGYILVARDHVAAFSEKQIALLKTFADQAVIAIENVRLFKELEARTAALTRSVDQLTALGEVGRAVSSTLDLETVLTTIVSRAVELSGLDGGVVFEYDEATEEFVHRVATETTGALAEARRSMQIQKGEGVVGRTALTLEPVQVTDITVPGAHGGRLRDTLIESGVRAVLAVPMVYERRLIGSLGVTRNRPGEFPAETIELLRTFATQSALAIQNARLFREIEIKSRQLEAASQHKSEFLANMSHELRTPLNAIIGFSEILAEKMFGDVNEKQTEYLQDILESGRHLLSLINDILDLSKIEAGRMELELTEFDLPSAIENALILVRERASRRGIRLGSTIDPRLGTIGGDERKVKQVLLNLLSNALKFTPEGGRIDVGARLNDDAAEVSVADTGIGIAPADQEAVFEEFRQVGTADKKAEGTGLGLALSRKFIELHGGRIWVKSQVGQGSTFTFTLPVRREK